MPNKGNNKRKIWKKYISEDLLPFEALDDFHKILKVIVKYKNLNEKISFYNFGDTKKMRYFHFLYLYQVMPYKLNDNDLFVFIIDANFSCNILCGIFLEKNKYKY